MRWLLTNYRYTTIENFITVEDNMYYRFYCDNTEIIENSAKQEWYIIRNAEHKVSPSGQKDKILHQYCKQTHHIKHNSSSNVLSGNLIRLDAESFTIYSDPFAIRKFFYWLRGDEFIISNDLKAVVQQVGAKPSAENMAVYALTYHFIGGLTAFQDIYYNKPGEMIEFKNGRLSFSTYWDAGKLLQQEKRKVSIREISDKLIAVVERNIAEQPQKRISLSLTGGADTRNLLSIFLKLGIKPHLYTYGNRLSADCVKARAIADGLGLEHEIHDIQITSSLFEEYARKIIRLGGGLASIHRVHRLLAVERERRFAEVMFLGTLGGEFIKGVSEDDYIVPAIIFENWHRPGLTEEIVVDYCRRKAVCSENIDVPLIYSFLDTQPFFNGDVISRKLFSLSNLTASLHDAQDVNLYRSVMDQVYTPFLNIEYLETVFASQFSFDNKERKRNSYLQRVENPVYASNFLKQVYPPLLRFEYSGNHKPSEVLINKYAAALIKAVRSKMRPPYPPNFPLSNWMVEFVERNLPRCRDYDLLKRTFELDKLEMDLKKGPHIPKESYWLRFTNPIMMMYILEEFGQ